MPAAFTKKFSEDNNDGQLRFSFYCDICRKEYTAPAVQAPDAQGVFHKWKSQKAYETAFENAQRMVKEHFNFCRVCNRWVCDECFRILPSADICMECAEKTGEAGDQNSSHRQTSKKEDQYL